MVPMLLDVRVWVHCHHVTLMAVTGQSLDNPVPMTQLSHSQELTWTQHSSHRQPISME